VTRLLGLPLDDTRIALTSRKFGTRSVVMIPYKLQEAAQVGALGRIENRRSVQYKYHLTSTIMKLITIERVMRKAL
jgi:hypothetical protein